MFDNGFTYKESVNTRGETIWVVSSGKVVHTRCKSEAHAEALVNLLNKFPNYFEKKDRDEFTARKGAKPKAETDSCPSHVEVVLCS